MEIAEQSSAVALRSAEKRNDTMEKKAVLRSASCMCVRLCCHVACSILEIHVNFLHPRRKTGVQLKFHNMNKHCVEHF